MKAQDIIDLLQDEVISLVGDSQQPFFNASAIDMATADSVSFIKAGRDDALELATRSYAGIILCSQRDWILRPPNDKTYIIVSNPRLAFIKVLSHFFSPSLASEIHPSAYIHAEASIHPTANIGPFCIIEKDCTVGAGSVLDSRVTLYAKTCISDNCIIHAGAVIGVDGFGYERGDWGEPLKFHHLGGVFIEANVEVGANACIARGTLSNTLIQEGCKIDNHVHIAHNVIVGRNTMLAAHAVVGGSVQIGQRTWISMSACIRDSIKIGNDVMVGIGAVVIKDIPDGMAVFAAPARPLPKAE